MDAYRHLLKHAPDPLLRAAFRDRALANLEAAMREQESSGRKPSIWENRHRSTLVEIHLDEHDNDAVWALATGGPVASSLLPRIAQKRGLTHPQDAIALYWKLLPDAIKAGQRNARYENAIAHVRAIRALRLRCGEQPLFAAELAALRTTWKAKRNFMKLPDTLG